MDKSLRILRPPQLMQGAEREEFALEAFATSDSWDARAGRVFTFPPLSAHRRCGAPFLLNRFSLDGEKQELDASADPAQSLAARVACEDGSGMGQPCAKALLNFCLPGVSGLGTPRVHSTSPPVYAPLWTPHLGVCVTQSHPSSCSCSCGLALPVRVSIPLCSLHLGATRARGSCGGAGAHGLPRCVPCTDRGVP